MKKHNKIIFTMYALVVIVMLVNNSRSLNSKIKEIETEKLNLEHKQKKAAKLIEEYEESIKQQEDSINYMGETIYKLQDKVEEMKEKIKELESIKIISMEATAYTDDESSQGKWVGQTATGRKPAVGVVAVDPKVIPLGTELYIEGYGDAIAGDTGGAIKGNRIDLFMSTRGQALEFGRRQVKVRIKE